ncbi:Major facilitator superfamily domain general substrate transporter [Penicillium riverlandense]|uniref:Major facilitator superfamily domain general substrate transporter n=1 Tax=Penicillium riverlandense TaxID=1903569 RepID=UPI002547E998|nr:Major facilitator superfamily domain general substrate transporter [Penicillium riverlandense]KAJ5819626.1 Major facilitator superfamily domain general substrate transporter [Penicillium riverlandense]
MTEHNVVAKILGELGLATMWQSSRDIKLLCAQRFVRMFAYSGSTLILVSYLAAMGNSDDRIGLFMTLTLAGDVVISFFLTLCADTMGRRAILSLGCILMAGSGVVFARFNNYWVLLVAAVLGVISPRYVMSWTFLMTDQWLMSGSGGEIGPFRAIEESTLAHLTLEEQLSDVFAWYSLIGTAGSASSSLICGWILTSLQSTHGWEFIPSCRAFFLVYAGIGVVKLLLTLTLSRKVEAVPKAKNQESQAQTLDQGHENSETRPLLQSRSDQAPPKKKTFFQSIEKDLWSLVIRLFILFGLDAFASGLAAQ